MKDIVIGTSDTFDVPAIRNWVNSLKATDFDGEGWMITYRASPAVKAFLAEKGINEYAVEHNYLSLPIQHEGPNTRTYSHHNRWYHAWELLTRLEPDYESYVVMTDVRDVIFQTNPSTFLQETFVRRNDLNFLAPSEGISVGKEPWNANNILQGFGPFYYELAGVKDWTVYNVGTIAGRAHFMRNMFHILSCMTLGRDGAAYPADQSAFNVLCHTLLKYQYEEMDMTNDAWAASMGTTHAPTHSYLWPFLHDKRPTITDDGIVVNPDGTPFVLVHQYDRVPGLVDIINARYTQ